MHYSKHYFPVIYKTNRKKRTIKQTFEKEIRPFLSNAVYVKYNMVYLHLGAFTHMRGY